MKQMFYLLGRENFSISITRYFDRFGWSNASITDLLADMQQFWPIGVDIK